MKALNKRSIARLISGLPINTMYLFGSTAREDRGPLSDVDVAIQTQRDLSDAERFHIKITLLERLSKMLKTDAVDLVVLEQAPPLLAHRILKEGRVLYCRNPLLRIRNEFRLLNEYLDFKEDLDFFAHATLHG